MTQPIRFCIALHNHQPVGNFDFVFEQAYQDSYLPFLDIFDDYSELRLSLHISGPLMEWLDNTHEDYVDRLAGCVTAGRIEILGGAFYEPILTMIPRRDRVAQITRYTRWLESRLAAQVKGMWISERVWEQSLTSDLAAAGIQFTLLDDFHFKNAGLRDEQLFGHYLSEDEGQLLNIFPGSERMRYLIPFGSPQECIDHLGQVAHQQPGAVIVFGDDGEKFGTWPGTKQHVYDNGWLRQFFDLLTANQQWIKTTTLSEALANRAPVGKVYLPEASYREMTEWALPTERLVEYEGLVQEMEHDPRWQRIRPFIRGGYWRNFKVKYAEADEMYSRMMMVSRRLEETTREGTDNDLIDAARRELYRGQCNCGYWHGAFGGIYLPHLRNAVYNHLIAAENLLDQAVGKSSPWVEATVHDYNLDARQEIRLANSHLVALIAPVRGGQLYELDVRSICHNLLATMTRRKEAYHARILAGANQNGDHVASIHDRVVFKQEGLDKCLQYDRTTRKSLLDHFYSEDANLEAVARGEAAELGDFIEGSYETKLRRNPDRIQVVLSRHGTVDGTAVQITKGVSLDANNSVLDIAYLLEGLPQDRRFHFAVEFNFAGLPAGVDDRFFYGSDRQRMGELGSRLDLADVDEMGLVDEWLGIDVQLRYDRPTPIWTYPVATVSQSEGGFELIHQSVVVLPHWYVQGDANGRWSTSIRLSMDTSLAESRMEPSAAVAAS